MMSIRESYHIQWPSRLPSQEETPDSELGSAELDSI